MNKKSLFKASFEESLNLEDDGFGKLLQAEHNKIVKHFKQGKPSFWFQIRSFLYGLFFSIGLNFFLLALALVLYDSNPKDLTVPISKTPLFTVEIFLICMFLWLLLVLLGKLLKPVFILPYRYQFHLMTTMVWCYLNLNLLAIDITLPTLSIWGLVAFYAFIGILTYFMFIYEVKNLRELMYGAVAASSKGSKIANMLATYGMGILGIGIIVRMILSGLSIKFSLAAQALGLFLTWLIVNIAAMAIIILIGFPYFLQAYYKWKYPEEYRQWEGKSLEEWYGKNYLKKHKELLKNE